MFTVAKNHHLVILAYTSVDILPIDDDKLAEDRSFIFYISNAILC